jgi:proteasome alpha subunit
MTYGDAIPVSTLVKKMCDYKQSFTQYGGARPFGTALLIAGMDEEGVHLYETDPSGAYQSYHAGAIGRGRSSVIDYFEGKWKAGMTKNAAIKLGLEALRESLEDDLNPETVEIASVDKDGYSKMDMETTLKHLGKLS